MTMTTSTEPPELAEMLEFLRENNYENLRVLDDGVIVGTINLMFTRALCVDLNWDGWQDRYCYEDRGLATLSCLSMQSGDDKPMSGYVAERHVRRPS